MVQLLPMNFGAYGGAVTYESTATRDGSGEITVPAAWPPAPGDVTSISVGPTQSLANDASSYESAGDQLDSNGDWVESPAFPPNYEMRAGSYQRSVGAFTFDVSEVDAAAMDSLNLTIAFSGSSGAWLFGIPDGFLALPDNPNYVASSGNITSTNRVIHLDWIGGSFADLDNFADILKAKADEYPFTGSAATLDLLDIMPNPYGGDPGSTVPVLEVPLSNWQDLVAESDWVSLVGSFADRPDVFWGWQDLNTVRSDSTPYVMRNWIGFDSAAFLNTGNPVTEVWLDVVLAGDDEDPHPLPDIAIAATASFSAFGMGLAVSGLAESPPDRRILSHAARQQRGW